MAADLATGPRTGLDVQLCGDAHLSNFGAFRAPSRELVFDINDFDETHPGPFEWDLKRLAASFEIGGRDIGFKRIERRSVVSAAVGEYRDAMAAFAGMRSMDVWYSRLQIEKVVERLQDSIPPKARKRFEKNARKPATRTASGPWRSSPSATATACAWPAARRCWSRSRRSPRRGGRGGAGKARECCPRTGAPWRPTTAGWSRATATPMPPSRSSASAASATAPGSPCCWAATRRPARAAVQGGPVLGAGRVHVAQPLLPARPPGGRGPAADTGRGGPAAGLVHDRGTRRRGRDYYVRQLWDGKGSAAGRADGAGRPGRLRRLCGWTLARAHARTGDRIAIAGYLGSGKPFVRALADFAEAYADQNERDFAAVEAAAKSGAIQVEAGV